MRRALALTLAAAVVGGCDAPADVPVAHTVNVWLSDPGAPLDDAAELLGLELVHVEVVAPGTVALFVYDEPRDGIHGQAVGGSACVRVGWAVPHPITMAHELGHLLGLPHVDDEANLMHPRSFGDGLTDAQLDTTSRRAGVLASCL